MTESSRFVFPDCMHALAAAMHMQGIDPHSVTISLPSEQWWKLFCALERKFRGLMMFDGRGPLLSEFRYMGFLFVPEVA